MTDHEYKFIDMIQASTVSEVFRFAGFAVPDRYDLEWNSRAGWIIRAWKHTGQPDAIFSTDQGGRQRTISRGWRVPQYSIPTQNDEPMACSAGAYGVWDSLPQVVRDGAIRHFRQFRTVD